MGVVQINLSVHEISFVFELCEVLNEPYVGSYTGLPVLDCSDSCFREELRRSDPINQVRENHPTSILNNRNKACAKVPDDLSVEVQKKRSQPFQKFRDGEQFGAQTIENSLAVYLRTAAKIASSNTFQKDEYHVRPPAKSTTKSWNWTFH